MKFYPNNPIWLVVCLLLVVVVATPIFWAHVFDPGEVEGDGVPLIIDPHTCDEERWALVNERYAAQGWPSIVIDRDNGVPIIKVAKGVIPDGYAGMDEMHGPERLDAIAVTADGERLHMMLEDQCANHDCTPEHKVWHMFVGDMHWGPTGYVGSSPFDRCGLKIPPYKRLEE